MSVILTLILPLLLLNRSVVSDSWQPHGLQHARLPCCLPTPRACSNLYPLSRWCHPNITSSFVPFSSCLRSSPASGSFPVSQFFASGGQSIGASASASILPVNIQGWLPLGLTGLISLQSKGLWRVFSSTTVQKHPFFGAQHNSVSFCPASYCTKLVCYSRYLLTSYFCIPVPYDEKDIFFGVSCRKPCRSSQNRSTSASLASVAGA